MMRWRLLFPLLPLVVGACVVATNERSSESSLDEAADAAPDAVGTGSTDPLDHLNVIASVAMEGRGTPSDGQDRAAAYVIDECKRAGVGGALVDGAYLQPFTVGGFGVAPSLAPPTEFGTDLFEEGLYLGGEASADTRKEMGARLCEAWQSLGQDCPKGCEDGTVDPRDVLLPTISQAAAARATNNIVATIPGSGPHKDEIILVSAHLDHLGKSFGSTYPGADDNGTGSSTLLALMHDLASSPDKLDRTVVFFWTSGEEKGLLGAAYFVDNPPVPLAKITQVINMDMVGAWSDSRFSIGVDSRSEAGARILEEAGREVGFTNVYRDVQSYNTRQDGYSFSRRQIPTIFVFEGLSKADGGGDLMPRYHRPNDTVENLVAENGGTKLRKMAQMLTASVRKLANRPDPVTDASAD